MKLKTGFILSFLLVTLGTHAATPTEDNFQDLPDISSDDKGTGGSPGSTTEEPPDQDFQEGSQADAIPAGPTASEENKAQTAKAAPVNKAVDKSPPAALAPAPAPSLSPEPPASLEAKLVNDGEAGSSLEPSDQFSRIPLRPQMSDANWRKWAGPVLEKNYKIHRGDTLWAISERLFGNPFLWPKVWQLNAVVGNPNVIPAGLDVQFLPGNPHSAPSLAFKSQEGFSTEDLPVLLTQQRATLMDRIDDALREQATFSNPPFKYFAAMSKPHVYTKVALLDESHLLLTEGNHFSAHCDEGRYSVVRFLPRTGDASTGYRMEWIGNVSVKNNVARVINAYSEIREGDSLIRKSFALSPLALHEEKIAKGDFMPLEEGADQVTGEPHLIGVRFRSRESGPRAGALVEYFKGPDRVARLLLLNRDEKVGTFWIIEDVKREIEINDDHFGD